GRRKRFRNKNGEPGDLSFRETMNPPLSARIDLHRFPPYKNPLRPSRPVAGTGLVRPRLFLWKEHPMFRTWRKRLLALAVAALGATLLGPVSWAGDGDFVALFNGKDLSGWKTIPEKADKTFQVKDGVIVVSGNPNGYFYTDKSYK